MSSEVVRRALGSTLATLLLGALWLGSAACSDEGTGGTSNGGSGGATTGTSTGVGGDAGGSSTQGGSGGSSGTTTSATEGGGGSAQGGAGGQALEWGELGGACGDIDDGELSSPDPFLFQNEIDFGAQAFDYDLLSEGGKEMWDDPNAGGSSHYSETLSFEIMHRCELAELLKTENEILYLPNPPARTDYLVSMDGHKVGVSVVRAFVWSPNNPQPYPPAEATSKMTEKLLDIQDSTDYVDPADAWSKQVLHVIAWDAADAATVVTAVQGLSADVRADTIVVVTATNGNDEFIYYE